MLRRISANNSPQPTHTKFASGYIKVQSDDAEKILKASKLGEEEEAGDVLKKSRNDIDPCLLHVGSDKIEKPSLFWEEMPGWSIVYVEERHLPPITHHSESAAGEVFQQEERKAGAAGDGYCFTVRILLKAAPRWPSLILTVRLWVGGCCSRFTGEDEDARKKR